MKTYDFDISTAKGIKDFNDFMSKLKKLFETMEFKEFIANKAQQELEIICTQKLQGSGDYTLSSFDEEAKYMNGMFVIIEDDSIILGNNSVIDISSKNMSPETKSRYSNELSLAKIVEFGVGSLGTSDETWEVNVNQQEHLQKYGRDGWYYLDDNGNVHWTRGIEGKFIFLTLTQKIKENITDWIAEYIETYL